MIACYRKKNQMTSFLHKIEQINVINVIFSINIIEGNYRISTAPSNNRQIVRKRAHMSGSFIDHVYIQNGFLESVNPTSHA